ncbi:MAG TPA: hypothetical protein VN801_05170, partial [Candidatus Udaeobacter sp.]|nr:hypothetical protein [Candidatus Udaeobacter sp.]
LRIAVVLRSEGDLLPIRRETRERAVTRTASQTPRNAALFADGIDLTRVTEYDLRSIRRWKTQQTRRVRQILPMDARD